MVASLYNECFLKYRALFISALDLRGMQASQVSDRKDASADRAIDGYSDTNFYHGQCAHTGKCEI